MVNDGPGENVAMGKRKRLRCIKRRFSVLRLMAVIIRIREERRQTTKAS